MDSAAESDERSLSLLEDNDDDDGGSDSEWNGADDGVEPVTPVLKSTRRGGILRREVGASPPSSVSLPTDIRRVDECLERLKRERTVTDLCRQYTVGTSLEVVYKRLLQEFDNLETPRGHW